ncbi:MAG TPA: immune inhibitor A [Candidatus Hydrogenedentes bacterium]|nr:immune inhibitor A [Candidatus Hydrogenedentota bacterium]
MNAKQRGIIGLCVFVILGICMAGGNAATNEEGKPAIAQADLSGTKALMDKPNPVAGARLAERQQCIEKVDKPGNPARRNVPEMKLAGQGRILMVLVEFGGADTFQFVPGESIWDPYGRVDLNEYANASCDCTNIVAAHGLTEPVEFTYTGPLHNEIPRPPSGAYPWGTMVWTEDFSKEWYQNLVLGDGVVFDYKRGDDSQVYADHRGRSVRTYYEDMSNGAYTISGDVIGWIQLPHSTWWYGADCCPGAKSSEFFLNFDGGIPGAGSDASFVRDVLATVNEVYPGFNWKQYDADDDGIVDCLWIVHAGLGEEAHADLVNATGYGEAAIWSHSSVLGREYEVDPENHISIGHYIVMPENGALAVFAHEYGHSLGSIDLYNMSDHSDTSAGFWTVMSDGWTGFPQGSVPPAFDPYHLDMWGWLNPFVITDRTQEYEVKIGQTSEFPSDPGAYRGVKIVLPGGYATQPVTPRGANQWWGGMIPMNNSMMTQNAAVTLPASGSSSLSFDLAYALVTGYNFFWIQLSQDDGATWETLTNENTTCVHAGDWIAGMYGFPDDMCTAGIGGFTGRSPGWPAYTQQTFDLSAHAGESIRLRFWYLSDYLATEGPFVDNIRISANDTIFVDDAENGDTLWTYSGGWGRDSGVREYSHNYFLQWRNTSETGGYDSGLGDDRFPFGPAQTGLLVWYNNNLYGDNRLNNYLTDDPGFGPKGRMLIVDAHPEPYRDPYWTGTGFNNEAANLDRRNQQRDAPFSLEPTPAFSMLPPLVYGDEPVNFAGMEPVSVFDDRLGYYPGAEKVSFGPGYAPASLQWLTVQWDSSVVVPSHRFYGINAPGYTAGEPLSYNGRTPGDDGQITVNTLETGLGYDGGAGNPEDAPEGHGPYGWKVEILSQTDAGATLRITNSVTNYPPHILPIPDHEVQEGNAISFTVFAFDPDEDTLTASAENLPANATFDPDTRQFDWTPPAGSAGTYEDIRFTVADGRDPELTATASTAITVLNTTEGEGASEGEGEGGDEPGTCCCSSKNSKKPYGSGDALLLASLVMGVFWGLRRTKI